MKTSSKLKIIFKSLLIVLLFLGSMVYIAGCQLQKGIQQGYKQGYDKGLKEGYTKGGEAGYRQGLNTGVQHGAQQAYSQTLRYFFVSCVKSKVFWIPVRTKEGKIIQQRFSCYKTGKDV